MLLRIRVDGMADIGHDRVGRHYRPAVPRQVDAKPRFRRAKRGQLPPAPRKAWLGLDWTEVGTRVKMEL